MTCWLPKQDLLQEATRDRACLPLEEDTYLVSDSMDQHSTTE